MRRRIADAQRDDFDTSIYTPDVTSKGLWRRQGNDYQNSDANGHHRISPGQITPHRWRVRTGRRTARFYFAVRCR